MRFHRIEKAILLLIAVLLSVIALRPYRRRKGSSPILGRYDF